MREQIVPLDYALLGGRVTSVVHSLSSREKAPPTSSLLVRLGHYPKGSFPIRYRTVGYCGYFDGLLVHGSLTESISTMGQGSTSRVPPRKGPEPKTGVS